MILSHDVDLDIQEVLRYPCQCRASATIDVSWEDQVPDYHFCVLSRNQMVPLYDPRVVWGVGEAQSARVVAVLEIRQEHIDDSCQQAHRVFRQVHVRIPDLRNISRALSQNGQYVW